ncbi:RidA family protein [Pseudomonas tolaasii]|uniref:RidA family protein n=1 Tax=Pseudomonas tolaasii TaxID=29442 RepID=UPI0015A2DAA2|nr:RidA family protein [Pseudomonas tolaasii]NWC29523.1 RidA family protein [Pseudomonas tolaasii]NWC50839.1 RidA family protein [Pseudomonas tolaasii]NWE65130.1 RidA family protein [Pseudomonas tolaasii]
MSLRETISALGLVLPETPSPKGDYVPVTIHGGVAYVSGQVCRVGEGVISGPVTDLTSPEVVLQAGQTCALRALSVLDHAVGLENVERILFVRGFVYGGEGFQNFSKVVDGASQVFIDVFGEQGRHARSAVGVAGLPGGGLLELEVTAVIKKH